MAEKFHTELENVKKDTVAMALLGRSMLRDAVDALVRQDKELAASVVAKKERIHEMEVELEEHCYQLIALNQPMAKDMRVIACTLKVITASVRIGRYGKVIANIVKEISDKPHIAHMMSIPHMAELVIDMIDDAIKAYDTETPRLIAGLLVPRRHHRCPAPLHLPRRDHPHDGRPAEHHPLHPLHHGGPVPRTLRRPCLQDRGERALHGDGREDRDTLRFYHEFPGLF